MRLLVFFVAGWAAMAQALLPLPASVTYCPGVMEFDPFVMELQPGNAAPGRLPEDAGQRKVIVKTGESKEDESYRLEVDVARGEVRIDAPGRLGALRGVATLAQLARGQGGRLLPCVKIEDRPRFAWRGLHLDVARHFLPVELVLHTIERMAEVKFNVLHLHLSDDQGVRVESAKYPLLAQKAAGGQFYTQAQIRQIVAHADQRGIRVVPEFDFPGHATAWFAAYPEFASAPGPYAVERKIGIFDPAFDPSNPRVYEFIEGFLSEMTGLFPDSYIHLGGDEVNGKQWDSNPKIQAFKRAEGLKTNHELQSYFETKMAAIVSKLGKKLILWDEAIHEKALPGVTYQAWRGPNALLASTYLQHPTLVSYGFYLDWGLSAATLYRNKLDGVLPDETDPILKRLNPQIPIPASRPAGMLTEAEASYRLGGEAALWSEFVTPRNLDVKLWPRAAAVAERLWSPEKVAASEDDLYRRLGLLYPPAPGKPLEETLEPGKYVYRHLSKKYTVDSAMDQLVDRLPAESLTAHAFVRAAELKDLKKVRAMLEGWSKTPAPVEMDAALAADAKAAVAMGLAALDVKTPKPANWAKESLAKLAELSNNRREIVVAIAPGVAVLVRDYESARATSAPQ